MFTRRGSYIEEAAGGGRVCCICCMGGGAGMEDVLVPGKGQQ